MATMAKASRICARCSAATFAENRCARPSATSSTPRSVLGVRTSGARGTTACASDSKKFGVWDQNLLTEWHIRYRGPGVMIYWHVEKGAVCVYSQLKSCSSSEVAAMMEGVLRHCTEMTVDQQYVDSHDPSQIRV